MGKLIETRFVKEILGIDDEHLDDSITMITGVSEEFVERELEGFNAPESLKRSIALLYASYLVRTTVFETKTEQDSYLATALRDEAFRLVKIAKNSSGCYIVKVNNRGEI